MTSKVYFGLLVALCSCYLSEAFPRPRQASWISQPLDHGNKSAGTFQQRYWVSDKFYTPGAPVFLLIGAEGEAPYSDVGFSFCKYFAKNVGALCMILEHRYYGQSSPVDPSEHQVDSTVYGPTFEKGTFKYLSSDQALEDIGAFIKHAKKTYDLPNNKWVTFGGSYAGSLSAWSKQKFPELIYAAVAHSAPLEAGIDFSYFHEDVTSKHRATADDDAAWWYQTCTEFGWYNQHMKWTTKKEAVNYVNKFCARFNESVTYDTLQQAVKATNKKHGGKNYFVERVILTHGSVDLWRLASITTSPGQSKMPVLVIPGAKHCDDMIHPPNPQPGQTMPAFDYPPDTDFKQVATNIEIVQAETLRILLKWLTG